MKRQVVIFALFLFLMLLTVGNAQFIAGLVIAGLWIGGTSVILKRHDAAKGGRNNGGQ